MTSGRRSCEKWRDFGTGCNEDEREMSEGDEEDRVNHGLEVVLSKLMVRVGGCCRTSFGGWKTDSTWKLLQPLPCRKGMLVWNRGHFL